MPLQQPEPIISISRARKLLGDDALTMNDDDVAKLLLELEQLAGMAIASYKVLKNKMPSESATL